MTENEAYGHIFPIVFSYTILLITPDTKYAPPFEAGAGVFVQIGERLFVATAAHCMKRDAFIANEKGFEFPSKPAVTILNRGADWDIDIGFLEVDVDNHVKALNRSVCSLDQLALSNLVVGDMHHVVGYPVGNWTQQGITTELVKCGFGSQFQEKEGDYLIFPFPKKENWFRPFGEDFKKATFIETPEGFSGGGLWAFNRVSDGELFVPAKHIKLRGIQSAWWIERRLVMCVPIQRWLELIHEAYPDLRPELEAKCPSLVG